MNKNILLVFLCLLFLLLTRSSLIYLKKRKHLKDSVIVLILDKEL
ncbi:hypothetical protein CpecS_0855 [Chlamydia pecorum VR629]|nr:hypothetical protein CpecS_0855 [Chlamydia pecorum VR629]